MFQQTKRIAAKCTNHKPENVIPSVMLRIQARSIAGKLSKIYQTASGRVESVEKDSPAYSGTFIAKTFIEERSHSWQAHLKRISSYLLPGKVWWKDTENGFSFNDSDSDVDYRPEGPSLCHYRSFTLDNIEKKSSDDWENIVQSNCEVPTHVLRIFDASGNCVANNTSSHTAPCVNHGLEEPNDMDTSSQAPSLNCTNYDASSILNSTENIPPLPSTPSCRHGTSFNCTSNDGSSILNNSENIPPLMSTPSCSTPHNIVNHDMFVSPITQVKDSQTPVRRRGTKRNRQSVKDVQNEEEGDETNYRIVSELHMDGIKSSTNGSKRRRIAVEDTQNKVEGDKTNHHIVSELKGTECNGNVSEPKGTESSTNVSGPKGTESSTNVAGPNGTESSTKTALISKHSQAIECVLGYSKDLAVLDKIHVELKLGNWNNEQVYLDILARFQTQVMKQKGEIDKLIFKSESTSYGTRMEVPGDEDKVYSELRRKSDAIKILTVYWEFH